MMKSLILASGSSYRKVLLKRLTSNFTCSPPNIDERQLPNESILTYVQRLSIAKASAAYIPDTITIGSDQSASINGAPLNKPGTTEKAISQLKACSGKTVHFHTGLCVMKSPEEYIYSNTQTEVHFLELSELQIRNYVETEQPLDCAGSFKCEGLGITLFKSITSTDPTALEGLPLIALCKSLRQLGLDPLQQP